MIKTKKELRFYIMADRIMNGYEPTRNFKEVLFRLLPIMRLDRVIDCLFLMREVEYFNNKGRLTAFDKVFKSYYSRCYNRLSQKLGFSIGYNVFGYGLVVPHYGTIVVNSATRAGNYCVLMTSTCIGGKGKVIGDGLYLSAGAKIMGGGRKTREWSVHSC